MCMYQLMVSTEYLASIRGIAQFSKLFDIITQFVYTINTVEKQ